VRYRAKGEDKRNTIYLPRLPSPSAYQPYIYTALLQFRKNKDSIETHLLRRAERTLFTMPGLFVRCLLFISSYFPLSAIFCILLWEKHLLWAVLILLIGLSGLVILLLYFLLIVPRRTRSHETVTSLERHDGDVLSYVASYLVPFVSLDLTGTQIWAVLVFLVVLLIIYVNSNMIYINPMLNILGYHLYEITIDHNEASFYLLTRQRVALQSHIHVVHIGDTTFLQVK